MTSVAEISREGFVGPDGSLRTAGPGVAFVEQGVEGHRRAGIAIPVALDDDLGRQAAARRRACFTGGSSIIRCINGTVPYNHRQL